MDMEFDSFKIDEYPSLGRVFLPLSQEIMIDGKLMDPWNDANVLMQKKEFFSRYKYLYENAAIIIALFSLVSRHSHNQQVPVQCGQCDQRNHNPMLPAHYTSDHIHYLSGFHQSDVQSVQLSMTPFPAACFQ